MKILAVILFLGIMLSSCGNKADRKGGSPLSCKIHLSPGMVVISLVVISSRPSRCIFWL